MDALQVNDFKPTVVIADDDPKMLAVVAKLLKSKFTVVGRAGDGFAALRTINEFRPQLAVLDVSMPKINGLDVAKQLNKAQSLTKVVFLSLLIGEDFVTEARRCAHGYVTKMRLYSDLYPRCMLPSKASFSPATLWTFEPSLPGIINPKGGMFLLYLSGYNRL